MTDRLKPPWDAETVEALNAYQDEAPMHPFTCPHRDRGHTIADRRDLGVLLATPNGWVCRNCDYKQDWAWPWMADTSWWQPGSGFEEFVRRGQAAQKAVDEIIEAHERDEIGGDECGDLLPGDEDLPLAVEADERDET